MNRYPHGVGLIVGRTSPMPRPIARQSRGFRVPPAETLDRVVGYTSLAVIVGLIGALVASWL